MIRLLLILLLAATPAFAEEGMFTAKRLSDDDFYRLVACSARPGGKCQRPFARWPARVANNLSVGIVRTDADFPEANAKQASDAIDRAIDEINGVGADVRLVRDDASPKIKVLLMNHPKEATLRGTGIKGLDGNPIQAARVQIWWNGKREITRSAIVITQWISVRDLNSVALEEIVQALGLLQDVDGPAYARRSIFAENDNLTVKLRGQDTMVVRRHYP